MENVRILGAGPSGLTAAINLARARYDVQLYEKRKDVGARFHGDLQGIENWSDIEDVRDALKRFKIDTNFYFESVHELTLTDGRDSWSFNSERPAFYLIKRGNVEGSFDIGMKAQALQAGVDLHLGETIPKDLADIVATGPDYTQMFAIVKGLIFGTVSKDIDAGLLKNINTHKGYSYLLVSNGYASICAYLGGNFERAGASLDDAKKTFSNLFGIQPDDIRDVAGFGAFVPGGNFASGNHRIVGEAAGIQDLLWGFGVRSSIESGYLAAQSIIEGKDYGALAKEHFGSRMKAGIVNRYLWEKLGSKDGRVVIEKLHKAKNPLNLLRSFYNFNIIQRIIYPLALWHFEKRQKSEVS